MNTNIIVIDADVFEGRIINGLAGNGMDREEARRLADSRWPHTADDVLKECRARGIGLEKADLTDYWRWYFERAMFDDDEPLEADSLPWPKRHLEGLIKWALENGRGHQVVHIEDKQVVTLADMFEALRSPDLPDRYMGGKFLSFALGAGARVAGETREDFENIIAPQISDLLGRAMAGELAAVNELERITTNNAADAFRPITKAEMARQRQSHG